MKRLATFEIRKSSEKAVATVAFWGLPLSSECASAARKGRAGRECGAFGGGGGGGVKAGTARALSMAAQPSPSVPLTRRPLLLGQVEGSQDAVTMAAIVPKEEGLISVSEDR